MVKCLAPILLVAFLFSCEKSAEQIHNPAPFRLVVLGNVQDAGSPHMGCNKSCCIHLSGRDKLERRVACLGLIDDSSNQQFLIEATPDIESQIRDLNRHASQPADNLPDGIAVTHAHIGHYTGLAYLGKESVHSKNIPVYAMPRMTQFLCENGPWSQLVSLNNIKIETLTNKQSANLSDHFSITPIRVPHRDEFSETVGFKISGPNKNALFIPDIDKWHLWNYALDSMVEMVDYAFIDATFFSGQELPHRDIKDIPHPLVTESMDILQSLSSKDRDKVYFIHLNHTNPLLNPISKESIKVEKNGFHIARLDDLFEL